MCATWPDENIEKTTAPRRLLRRAIREIGMRSNVPTARAEGGGVLRLWVLRFAMSALCASLAACGGGGGGSSSSAGTGATATSDALPASTAAKPTDRAASRLLEQASFGPTPSTIADVQKVGYAIYIDHQIAASGSDYPNPTANDSGLDPIQQRFFVNAVSSPDQLRQRVALALGEIFVISGLKVGSTAAFVPYERLLLRDAFTTYETLLRDVSMSPAMGRYLDMVDNEKADPVAGTSPNENYAREIMQLFSIGLNKLNPDGTAVLDTNGLPVPAYTQDQVEGMAAAFTGWTFAPTAGTPSDVHNPENYALPMIPVDSTHDTSQKTIVGGAVLPAGMGAQQELDMVMHVLATHPNTGPFIARRLIQSLVTSNPSPAYVKRIANVFDDDGRGTHGNLAAVVKAILLDLEARRGDSASTVNVLDGKLKEPVLFMSGLMRALGATTNGASMSWNSYLMRQDLFNPPNVFNYFPPDYGVSAGKYNGPEFKLYNAPTIAARANFANGLLYNYIDSGTSVDITPWVALLAQSPATLVDAIDQRFLHGSMSAQLRSAVLAAVQTIAPNDPNEAVRAALYVVATSPAYNVQH